MCVWICVCVFDLHFTEVFLENIHNVYSADKPLTQMHFHLEQYCLLGANPNWWISVLG